MVDSAVMTELRVRVRTLAREADDVLSVEFEALAGALPRWTPGSHIDLVVPGAPVRQYSLCGDPASPRYRIAVRRETESRGGSRAIHERLRPGDEVVLREPRNHFVLEPAAEYLFIAGGIGITPLLPMLREASERGAAWRLLYLGSSRSRMPFLDEIAGRGGDCRVIAADEGTRADLVAEVAASPDALVYACGPERMLSALAEAVTDDSERLRMEYFSAPEVHYEPGGPFRIRLDRSGLELDVSPDETILEVMRGAGVDVLTDCEEGICGSCETRIVDGEAEHRDFVLTAQEKSENHCLMVCVSRASCPVLVLDA
ncbi:PDR/VanB family oxidoreductase [Herbiconiux ginsengi]|uniref:Ferredoxin-NADP reductase n=1 Tax=Herbiconiux ginsengi TaxID=381665 RepID=A0A1H3SX37_9MICO|nr:PDR/VanB family oxidoreductase [Herbiconiux ginsengi]SDZ42085.1 Ferredoxin-NADP reductase [Herbiconiux ginsengi]